MNKRTLHPTEEHVKRGRRYESPLRQEQAELTRQRILDAARELFFDRGYASTAIGTIASEAGVSGQSVYGIFGTKRAILMTLIETAIGGEGGPEKLMETEGPQRMRRETDQRAQLRMLAGGVTGILEQAGPLFLVMRDASAADDDIADAYAALHAVRYRNMGIMVGWIADNGPLKSGMSLEEATDIVWALTSADMHHLLRNERGWAAGRYQAWLADSMDGSILIRGISEGG